MTELINTIDQTFNFNSNTIRVVGNYNEPWFVAKDICNILELSNVTEALRNIPKKWMASETLRSSYNSQNMNIISEPAVYKLIMRSNKLIAQKFQEYVCEEILPSIRKAGEFKLKEIIDTKNRELKIKEDEKKLVEHEKKLVEDQLKITTKENKNLHTLVKKKKRKRYSYSHSVYIISNPHFKNYFKIGMTSDRNKRLAALAPGAPQPYDIEYSRELCNAFEEKAIESLLLGIFDKFRVETETHGGKQREWIKNVKLDIIKKELDTLADYYQNKKKYYTNEFIEEDNIEVDDKVEVEVEFIDDKDDTDCEYIIEDIIENNEEINNEKPCYKCKEYKPLSEYYDKIENKDGKEGTCKLCYSDNKKILKKEKDERELIKREEGTKKCRTCKNVLNFECFGKHGTSKDGYEYVCLECKKQDAKNIEEKRCEECRKTQKIINFNTFRLGYSNFCKECENKDEKYKKKETEYKKCSSCKNLKSIEQYSKCSTSADGYYNYCSECSKEKSKKQKENQKQKEKIIVENKVCCKCKEEKDTSKYFYKNQSSKDGFRSKCIDCEKEYDKELRLSKMK